MIRSEPSISQMGKRDRRSFSEKARVVLSLLVVILPYLKGIYFVYRVLLCACASASGGQYIVAFCSSSFGDFHITLVTPL